MGVISEVLGNHGAAHHIEHKGKQYPIYLIDEIAQGEFEKRWYEKECKGLGIQKDAGLISDDAFRRDLMRLTEEFRNGDYEMVSPRGVAHMQTLAGAKLLLSIITRWTLAETLQLLMAKQAEVLNKIQLVITESFPDVDFKAVAGSETSSPNLEAPAETAV